MCDYTGHEFGASYPDSCCIDGFLWDLDSGDSDGWCGQDGAVIRYRDLRLAERLARQSKEGGS